MDTDPPINEAAPFIDEVKEIMANLRVERQLAFVTIPELLKAGDKAMIYLFHAVLTAVWHSGTILPD